MHKDTPIKQVLDTDDEIEIPNKDTIIELDGKVYNVLTGPQFTTGAHGALSVYTVYLEEV